MPLGVPHLLGAALALVAAGCFAVQFLCVRLGTVRGTVNDVVLVSLLTNVAIAVPLVVVVHGVPSLSGRAIVWFALAGLSGSLVARLLMFRSVQVIGASRTSPVIATNVFFASILAVAFFGEALTAPHAVGIVFIVVGVAVLSWETARDADPDQSLRDVGLSLLLPLIAAVFIGFEPILVSLGLDEGAPVLPGVVIKALAATIAFAAYLALSGQLTADAVRWSPETKWYVGAGVTSALGIIAFFAALEVAPVIVVVPLVQTSPLLVVLLSAVVMPQRLERITWRLVAAAVVVVVGVSIVGIQ